MLLHEPIKLTTSSTVKYLIPPDQSQRRWFQVAEWLINQWLASWFHNGFVYVKILLKIEKKSPEVFLKVSLNSQETSSLFFLHKITTWDLQLYQKWYSGTGVYMWILRNFQELFYRTPPSDYFWSSTEKKNLIALDTGRNLNVHKTFRRRSGRLLNVWCTFNLRPVSAGIMIS